MKVTRYMTNENYTLKAEPLTPVGGPAGCDLILRKGDAPINECKGFGVALTGSSCWCLMQMDPAERHALLEKVYGEDGLNFSIARLPIGSCDYSAELYTYDDEPEDMTLAHFSIEKDREYILPVLKEVVAIRPDITFYASPWSPPGWMKTGGAICGGYMRDKYLDVYADYLIKYLDAYEKEGIHITALTPQNEPDVDQVGRFPACIWNPEQIARFVLLLSGKLKAAGRGDVDIWFNDHNFIFWKQVVWMLDEYPQLLDCCSSAAFHYYSGCIEMVDSIKEKYPQIKFQFTEGGPRLRDHYATDWCKWTTMMAKALNHWHESFTGWNLMLDEEGRPNIGHCYCGGLVTRDSVTGELSYSGQYKAFAQVSRFIRKGAKIYATTMANDGMNVSSYYDNQYPVAALWAENPDGTNVLVLANANKAKRQVKFDFAGEHWYVDVMQDSVNTIVFEK